MWLLALVPEDRGGMVEPMARLSTAKETREPRGKQAPEASITVYRILVTHFLQPSLPPEF